MNLQTVIQKTVTILNQGGLILYPTDTVWGIGCDATNEIAVRNIFDLKNRPTTKSMILLIESPDIIQPYVSTLSEKMKCELVNNVQPQTVILPNAHGLAPSVMSPQKTIAVRCPKNDFCLHLLKAFGKPLVSTSANLSGQQAAKKYIDIHQTLRTHVDFIVPPKYEKGATGQPSRIVQFESNGSLTVIRP